MKDYTETSWHGVRFVAPNRWRVQTLDKLYIQMVDEVGPILEIKWGKVKGPFSPKAQLKKIAVAARLKIGRQINFQDPPVEWKKALSDRLQACFVWQTDRSSGYGLMLYCQSCQKVFLLQFHGNRESENQADADRVIESFQEYCDAPGQYWSIFDIRFQMPPLWRLNSHRFEAGRFVMEFKYKNSEIELYRWGPAGVLLRNQSLSGFMDQTWGGGPAAQWYDETGVEYTGDHIQMVGDTTALLHRLFKKPIHRWRRLWRIEDKNRLLGVRAYGVKPLDGEMLERVCKNYECV